MSNGEVRYPWWVIAIKDLGFPIVLSLGLLYGGWYLLSPISIEYANTVRSLREDQLQLIKTLKESIDMQTTLINNLSIESRARLELLNAHKQVLDDLLVAQKQTAEEIKLLRK